MNIVYATRAAIPYPSAASLNSVQMCQSLVTLGHTVTLAIGRKLWRKPTWPTTWSRYYGFRPQFRIQRIWELPRTGWWFDDRIVRLAERHRALVYLRYPRLLDGSVRRSLPTILEIHSSLAPAEIQLVAAGLRNGSLLGVVVITAALKHRLLQASELAPYAARFLVAADAVNCARFGSEPHRTSTAGDRVSYFGSLYPGKGVELMLRVAQLLPHVQFDIFGGRTPERRWWSQQAAGQANVHFVGHIPPAQVPTWMARYAIALLPNQPSIQLPNGDDIGAFTSPMKLFEYMAAGQAIIASDLPGLREVLRDRQNCLLAPHDSPEVWAAAIQQLGSDVHLRHQLAFTARQEAVERYSYETRFRTILRNFIPQAA